MMRRRLFIINTALIAAVILMGVWFYKVWVRPLVLPVPDDRQQVQAADDQRGAGRQRPMDMASYDIISSKDLFRPSRTPVDVSVAGVSAGVISTDTPKLFGTIIKSDKKFAILEDPVTKTSKLYTLNESVAGYIVNDIQQDKVVLLRGSVPIEVKLREAKTFKAPVQRNQPVINRSAPSRRQLPSRRTVRRPPVRRTPAQPTTTRPQPGIEQPQLPPGVEMPDAPEREEDEGQGAERHPFEAQ